MECAPMTLAAILISRETVEVLSVVAVLLATMIVLGVAFRCKP
jgi:hypothetical protein